MALNPKQEAFCTEYARSGNATAAYRSAYGTTNETTAASNASKLLRNANVLARLAEIQAEISGEKICSAQEVQERLSAIARRELTETVYLSGGEQVQKQVSVRDSLRALEVLAKIQGLFITRQEVDLRGFAPVVIAGGDCLLD